MSNAHKNTIRELEAQIKKNNAQENTSQESDLEVELLD